MPTSALRDRVTRGLLSFAWNEWAQLGVLANVERESPWAADPEAYVVFTLQVARSDARLFAEVLDWTATNASLLSVQRLRNMYAAGDERLVEAAWAWVEAHADGRPPPKARAPERRSEPEPLFYELAAPSALDPIFSQYGFVAAPLERTLKSRRPEPRRPVNFAFLLRQIFGVSVRAEVMRFLVTAGVPSPTGSRPLFTAPAVAEAAGYSKRNVQEALNALIEAGAVGLITRGSERLYEIDRERWREALRLERIPQFRDWPFALLAFRELHRWLWRSDLDELSPYMRASEARLLMDQIESSLRYAGIFVPDRPLVEGEDYWDAFEHTVDAIVNQLKGAAPW